MPRYAFADDVAFTEKRRVIADSIQAIMRSVARAFATWWAPRPLAHVTAGIIATCVACMTLSAQDAPRSRSTEWGIMVGGVGVTGAFRGHISTGAGGGLELQIPLPPSRVALRADVMYHTIADYDGTDACPRYFCANPGIWTDVVSGAVSVVARLNSPTTPWSPYIIGGVAIYHVGTANSPIEISSRPNPFGFHGGVGFEVRSGKHTYFAEMRYMGMSPGGLTPLTIGMRF